MEEENGIGDGSSEGKAPEGEPLVKEVLMVDGKAYTPDEIRSLSSSIEETKANLLTDYHSKMAGIKAEREELGKLRGDVEGFAAKFRKAKDEDLMFFTTNTADKWSGYKSKVDEVLGFSGGGEGTKTPDSSPPSPEVEKLRGEIDELHKTVEEIRAEKERERADNSLRVAEGLIKKEFPLADLESVEDALFKFYSLKKKIPSEQEVREIVKRRHEKVASLEVVRRVAASSKLPSPKEGYTPKGLPKVPPKLSDVGAHIDAGAEFFKTKQAARSGG